jgi:hypothetical protein
LLAGIFCFSLKMPVVFYRRSERQIFHETRRWKNKFLNATRVVSFFVTSKFKIQDKCPKENVSMKTNHLWRLTSTLVLLAMLISPIGSAYAAPSERQSPAPQSNMRVVESTPVVSQPLRSLAPIKVDPNAPNVLKKIQV